MDDDVVVDALLQFLQERSSVLALVAAFSLVSFVGTLLVVPVLLARMRADYFVGEEPPPGRFAGRHPLIGGSVRVVKNVLGALLLAVGLAMLVLPGQGILTILIGVALVDFPRKRKLERWLVCQKGVRRTIDWIRRRSKKPPLILEGDEDDPPESDGESTTPEASPR